MDVRLDKGDVVGGEDATVASTVQVVEVGVVGAAKVAHLLAAGIQGADLAVHVGVHSAAKGSKGRDVWRAAIPLPVRVQSGALGQTPMSLHACRAA
jgi:hypothetical protein